MSRAVSITSQSYSEDSMGLGSSSGESEEPMGPRSS